MTRTVRDAAVLLNVLAAADPLDAVTEQLQRPADYTSFLDKDGLNGVRIGVPSDPSDPGNDFYYGPLSASAAAVMRGAISVLEAQGAVIVRANIPTEGWIGGPGTEMAILNRNPESPTLNQPVRRPIVFVTSSSTISTPICETGPPAQQCRASPTSLRSTRHMPTAHCVGQDISSPPRRPAAISASSNTSRLGRWICAPRAHWGSTPI